MNMVGFKHRGFRTLTRQADITPQRLIGILGAIVRGGICDTPCTVFCRAPLRQPESAGIRRDPSPPQTKAKHVNDPTSWRIWRHCAIRWYCAVVVAADRRILSARTEMSAVTWVGRVVCFVWTRVTIDLDGKDYVIRTTTAAAKPCGRCLCKPNESDTPLYIPFQSTITTGLLRKWQAKTFPYHGLQGTDCRCPRSKAGACCAGSTALSCLVL